MLGSYFAENPSDCLSDHSLLIWFRIITSGQTTPEEMFPSGRITLGGYTESLFPTLRFIRFELLVETCLLVSVSLSYHVTTAIRKRS